MGRTSDAKNKILDAAATLIEQRGYTALGVAEICAAAGVPKGSFYYFFESKQALAPGGNDEPRATPRRPRGPVLGSQRHPQPRPPA
ncbi:helix-turn-helix domain-containing protein, partial [Micromonospora vinacea]|uniref:TetR/AcrR family transcriptional regulator n=1 Tax=Micromonospora vinacea TaxID=709878 RepID=UPI00344F588C